MKKATLAGYRHLLSRSRASRPSFSQGHAALERLRTILTTEIEHILEDEAALTTLIGEAVECITTGAQGCELDPRGVALWNARFDCADEVEVDVVDAWAMVGARIKLESCADAASLLRTFIALGMLARAGATSLSRAADSTLG